MDLKFSIYISLLGLCCLLIFLNRRRYPAYWGYWFLVVFAAFAFELPKVYLGEQAGYVLNHLYQPVEFSLMILLYSKVLKSRFLDRHKYLLIALYWLLALGMTTYIEGWEADNRLSFYLGSLLVVILVMGYFYQIYLYPIEEGPILSNPFFWVNTANLFYFSGTYFYMALHEMAGQDPDLQDKLHLINVSLNYMLYLLYIVGTLCRARAT